MIISWSTIEHLNVMRVSCLQYFNVVLCDELQLKILRVFLF
jgi:hypothetical protein